MAGGGGGGGVAAAAAAAAAALPFRLAPGSGRLTTVRQPGRAGVSGTGSSSPAGGGGGRGGPGGGMNSSGRYLGRQSGEYSPPALCLALTAISSAISCCSVRRSSRSFPTSWRRMRTSLARALLKSFTYLDVAAVGEKGPVGLLEAIWIWARREECYGWLMEIVVQVVASPRRERHAADLTLPDLGGLPGLALGPEAGLDGTDMADVVFGHCTR